MALDAARLCGGPHDGERVVHPPTAPLPEDLVAIGFDDGVQYARTSEELPEGSGETVVRFRYDPDGALTREAKLASAESPRVPTGASPHDGRSSHALTGRCVSCNAHHSGIGG